MIRFISRLFSKRSPDSFRQADHASGRNRLIRLSRRVIIPVLLVGIVADAVFVTWGNGWGRSPETPRQTALLREKAPPGMTLIPAGEFWMGSNDPDDDDDVRPKRRVFLPSFYMDIHEVTNREFHEFDPSHTISPEEENLPASNITYDQAAAYARWAGKRLPTEAEWEKAARGTDGRRFPWGNEWNVKNVAARRKRPEDRGKELALSAAPATGKFCAVGPSRLQPVSSIPAGISPYGCYDMAGNAWEWVQGFYNGNKEQRILRGGAVGYGERACRVTTRTIEGAADT